MPENHPAPVTAEAAADAAHPVLTWIGCYAREIVAVCALLIGGAVVFAIANQMRESAEAAAWEELFRTEHKAQRSGDAAAGWRELREKRPDSTAAAYALSREIAACADKPAEAEKAARLLLERYPASPFSGAARLALGRALLTGGKVAEARTSIEQALGAAPGEFEPELRLALGLSWMKSAEAATDDTARRSALEQARTVLLDLRDRSRTAFWPAPVVETASFAALLVSDRLRDLAAPAPKQDAAAPQAATPAAPTPSAAPATPAASATPATPPAEDAKK